ncbi:kinesin-domain-containing protein [Pseudovirgaria hyperparasitica]|uniref:Kinesin-like protein n=1 Tax=Pseudovirgaria hyperparasitica TaxID=470096 RepID=A0A6A6VSG0_9PEZI|nr:kinesin-domain-containing protein [Pseudovirgaria hyperparasitica]KAF2752809.1 kinesin-domain-containing protein [Pseudovirgaria hyperparasitica]
MATTLPRPSRPSASPPNAPLPSLPVAKLRDSTSTLPDASTASPRASVSSLRSQNATRAVSSSALPTKRPQKDSTTPLPTLTAPNTPSGIAPPGKLRKTISIGSFPQPPRGIASASKPSSPLSCTSTPSSKMPPPSVGGIPNRGSSLRRSSSKMSTGSVRSASMRSPMSPPSLFNANGDMTMAGSGLLSIPSPPHSRNSSAQDSYATSATTFDDLDLDDVRGREGASHSDSKLGKDGKGNVTVSVRVRPDAGSDGARPELEWMVDGRRSLISYKGKEGGEYIYDNVFATHDNNSRVYDAAAKRLVRRVMEGYHGTVFAYGMTGTGKTFSMQGTASSPGVIPLAITDIFSYIRETPHREFLLRVSYLEIYNEKINDLLTPAPVGPNGQPGGDQVEIKLREDSKRGVYATPLKEEIVQSPTQLLRVIARGDSARRVAGTQFNARSSRSHAVVQIVVESRERVNGSSLADKRSTAITPGGVRVSTLSLIDLAGSERAAEDKARRTEGAHINKSLLTLGTVIANLSGETEDKRPGDKKAVDKSKHLPYRDSKLTRLLQPALSGNSLVSILCTIQIGSAGSVAAAHNHTAETLNTLKFASRAKNNIVSHAKKAEEAGGGVDARSLALLDRYRIEITELRKQLEEAQTQTKQRDEEEEEKVREVEAENRHEEQMLEMQLARTALKERIEHLNRLILSSKSIGVNNTTRTFSALSTRNRGSVATIDSRPVSARSSTASHALEVPSLGRTASGGSRDSLGTVQGNGANGDAGSEEEDAIGDNGDGTASSAIQVRALQADLADKNRYISTLEKRLLQARRSSQSRVSMGLAQRMGNGEEGSMETIVKERDAEIAELRARLDDKDRMITALRSAARKRDVADLRVETSTPTSRTSPEARRRVSHQRSEGGSNASSGFRHTPPTSPVGLGLLTEKRQKVKGVEEMTRILDEMITETAAGGNTNHILRRGSTLKVVSEAQ